MIHIYDLKSYLYYFNKKWFDKQDFYFLLYNVVNMSDTD